MMGVTLAYLSYPPPEEIERRAQILAVLDAVLSPEWDDRCFSFDRTWSEGARLASARNGSGDESFMLFRRGECVFKQFLHEVPLRLSSSEVQASAGAADRPFLLEEFLAEPAFSTDHLTELGWCVPGIRHWAVMQPAGGIAGHSLFGLLFQGNAPQYATWASDLAERPVRQDVVELVSGGAPLTPSLVHALNPEAHWECVRAEAAEMGYPA